MPKLLRKVTERVQRAIAERVFPGCVVGYMRKGGERGIFPFGNLTYEPGSPKVREDTIYDVASITKSIPTASLALSLVAEEKIKLEDLVRKYIPELQNDYDAKIENLLRYEVSGIELSKLKDRTAEEILVEVFAKGFIGSASKASIYTNLPALLLGIIIERVSGERLDALAQKEFFDSLGMMRTTFSPARFPRAEIAPTEIVGEQEIRGIVHDESARVFAREGIVVGHAGLFSTAPDILNFLGCLLENKYQHITRGAEQGLGWELCQSAWMGKSARKRTFGKTGFTGTSCVVDSERGIAFVILSNRTYPQRPQGRVAMDVFRADIADMIFAYHD